MTVAFNVKTVRFRTSHVMTYIFRTHTPRDLNILIYAFVHIGLIFIMIFFYLDQPDTKSIFGYSHISTIPVQKEVHPAANRPHIVENTVRSF